jgi:bifunctional DNA-binding transcriptional regulator/antitoxin component of YhaV-PrlF toxin-antitoxin module
MKTTVSHDGRIVLPEELLTLDRIEAGQQFVVERLASGRSLLKRVNRTSDSGLVDWLLKCPVKKWIDPLASESTDSI